MKFRIWFSAVVLSALSAACTSAKMDEEGPRAKESALETVNAAAASAATSASTVSEAELLYVKALREKDRTKRNEMFKDARKALLAEAENGKNLKAHLLLGYMADLGQGMPPDGIQAARHYRIAADGGITEAKIALAEFWRRNGIFLDEAVKQLVSIPGYEENPAALCSLGSVYYAMFENEKGFEYLKKAYCSPRHTPHTRMEVLKILHLAFETYFKGNHYDAAMKELRRADELDSANYLIPYLMGLVEIRKGRLAEAEKMFERSWKRNPAVPETYREMAFLKVRSGHFDEAVDNVKTAYAVSGNRPEFERALLEIYILTKRIDELLVYLNRQLTVHPERKELRLIRISILQQKKEYRKAYDDLMILLKNHPKLENDPAFQESFANLSSVLGKYDDAVKANEQILKQGFRPVPALNLSELYIITNQFEKAVELLRHPGFKGLKDPLIQCVVPYLEACALLASGKKADEQVQMFKTALPVFLSARKSPSEWDVTMFMGWLKKSDLPEPVKKQILEMTESISALQSETGKKDQTRTAPVQKR